MADRNKIAKKMYVLNSGEEERSASDEVERLEFRFTNDYTTVVRLSDFPENIRTAFAWYGAAQKLGDVYSKAEGGVDDAIELHEALLDRLKEGTWVKEGAATGPRVAILVEAIGRVRRKANLDFDPVETTARYKADAELRTRAMSRPDVAAEYEAIKLEAQQKRVDAARAKVTADLADVSEL